MTTFTKKILAEGLKELLNQKPMDQITVKELVTVCGVTRQTFYYHFQDIYQLLEWLFENDFLKDIKESVTQKDWQTDLLTIFEYIQTNRNFCLNAFFAIDGTRLAKYFHTASFEMLSKVMAEFPKAHALKKVDETFILDFYCYSLSGVVTEWIIKGMQEDPKEIVSRLSVMMVGAFPEAIERFLEKS